MLYLTIDVQIIGGKGGKRKMDVNTLTSNRIMKRKAYFAVYLMLIILLVPFISKKYISETKSLQNNPEDNLFEIINIKDHTKRKDLKRIRARIIGKKGKALGTLHQLTKCNFELKDNSVGIIGDPEFIENAQEAIISIIRGSKHSNVYSNLEKHQVKPIVDLGLKE